MIMQNKKISLIIVIIALILLSTIEAKQIKNKIKKGTKVRVNQQILNDNMSNCKNIKGNQVCSYVQEQSPLGISGWLKIGGIIIVTVILVLVVSKSLPTNTQSPLIIQFQKEYLKNQSVMSEDDKQQIVSKLMQANFNIQASTANQQKNFKLTILQVKLGKQNNSFYKLIMRSFYDGKQCIIKGSLIFYKKKFGIIFIQTFAGEKKNGQLIFKGFGNKVSKVNGDWYSQGYQLTEENSGTWTIG